MTDDDDRSYGQRLRDKGIQMSPKVTPTRTPSAPSKKEHHNSWERGKARDDRGMPYLDSNLNPIGVKRFAEEFRHKFEAQRAGAPPPDTKG
jgi:hypothetical protein